MSQNRSIARPALVAATALFGLAAGLSHRKDLT